MMTHSNYIRALCTLLLVFGITQPAISGSLSDHGHRQSLVIVKQIIGIDEQGQSQALYQEDSGRIYRLDNIDQAVHDLSSKPIRNKGTYRELYVVLADTVYVMDQNRTPRPTSLKQAGIDQKIALSVDNIRVTKDRVIAIYTTNCQTASL